jgi:hypothetical protein
MKMRNAFTLATVLIVIVNLAIFGGLGYVAIHFIAKFW